MTQRRKRNKKWAYWLVILILIIIAGLVGYLVWDSYFRVDSNQPKTEENSVVDDKKELKEGDNNGKGDENRQEDQMVDKPKVEQYDGDDPNVTNDLSGVVTYAGVVGANLMIRVNIDQYLTSGQCDLTLSRNGATIFNSIASIVGGASTATCEGFDIPVNGLGGGNIVINIKLTAEERSGVIRGEVNI